MAGGIMGNSINNRNKISQSREAHTITTLISAKTAIKTTVILFVGVLLILWPTTTQAEDAILTDLHKYVWSTLNENVLYINLMNPSERFRKNFDERIAFGEGPGGGQIQKPWMKLATHIKDHNLYVEVEILDGSGWAYFDNNDMPCPWCGTNRNPCGRDPQYRCETKLQLYKGSEKVAEYSLSQVYHDVILREYYYLDWGARSRWYGTISLNGLTEGTYVLRAESYYVREYDYYKYQQGYKSMNLTINIFYATAYPKKTYYYGFPGENISTLLQVRGPHKNVTASLYDPTTNRWLSVPSPQKIAEEDTPFGGRESTYEVNYSIPQSAQLGSMYQLQFRVTYPDDSAQDVMTFIVVGEDPDMPTQIEQPPELQYVCPFLVNPVWALAGQTATIGCYDNPGDDFTVVQGTVFMPQVGITQLEPMNEQQFVASTPVPSVEGIYNAIYELKVRNSKGQTFTVNGSQQVVVTATPEGLYCPPPGDGVSSSPASEGRVGLRLVR